MKYTSATVNLLARIGVDEYYIEKYLFTNMAKFIRIIKQIFGSTTEESLVKLVGTDRFQNKFYERLPGRIFFFFFQIIYIDYISIFLNR